jgi:hypothetical protein
LSDLPADEALARLRPDLLRPEWRGRAVEIYIDGRPASILMLHELRATDVAEARLLSPEEARLEFGAPASNPILRITLARSGK